MKLIVRLLYIKQKRLKFIKFLSYIISNHQSQPVVAGSIPPVARKREWIAPTFSTPPGSPFCALLPHGPPLVEPKCHRGEKDRILSSSQW